MSLLCDDWYCVNVVGQASGLEKYECVSLDLLMRLFSMVSRKAMWLCMGEIVCGEWLRIVLMYLLARNRTFVVLQSLVGVEIGWAWFYELSTFPIAL